MDIFDYYRSLPKGQKNIFRRKAAKTLGIAESTFSIKLRTKKWKPIESKALQTLIEEHRQIFKTWIDVK